jgi:hypothetical protein
VSSPGVGSVPNHAEKPVKFILAKPADRPLNRGEAWGCVVQNQLMWPGLGTCVAGKKKAGRAQMALSLVGAALFPIGAAWFSSQWLNPLDQRPGWFGPEALPAWGGLACLAAAWFWALRDSLWIVRATVPDEE